MTKLVFTHCDGLNDEQLRDAILNQDDDPERTVVMPRELLQSLIEASDPLQVEEVDDADLIHC